MKSTILGLVLAVAMAQQATAENADKVTEICIKDCAAYTTGMDLADIYQACWNEKLAKIKYWRLVSDCPVKESNSKKSQI